MERNRRRKATIGIIILLLLLIVSCDVRGQPREQYCREQGYASFKWVAPLFSNFDFYCLGPGQRLVTEEEFKEWEER